MKEFQIKSVDKLEAQKTNYGPGNEFFVKQLTEPSAMQKCAAALVEVEPGNTAYGYHWHETWEEIFYVISGQGSIRTVKGELPVEAGDAISFPTGEGGSHVIQNTSKTEKLIYIDFGTRGECEIAHMPDAKKLMAIGQTGMNVFDEPTK